MPANKIVSCFMTVGLLLVASLSLAAPVTAEGANPVEWALPNGYHYTQTNSYPSGLSPMGFPITDERGILFWSEFKRMGGVDALGYPIGSRYTYQGFVCQAVQKGIMQWLPTEKRVAMLNVFDLLHDRDQDGWLLQKRSTPVPLDPSFDQGRPWAEVIANRVALLDDFPAIRARYNSVADPLTVFGLPTSRVTDMGNHYAVRLQRAVIQQWKVDTTWAKSGQTTVANGGDVAKEAGLFSAYTADPEDPPGGTWKPAQGQYKFEAVTTWYGEDFHGQVMAGGEIYDMNNPSIAACNMFPLGTKLRVTSKNTGKSVEVVIKDTGAFRWPIATDLSHAAFAQIDNPARGVIPVMVELLP